MSADLDTLSREIAATSDDWIVPGVEAIVDEVRLRLCVVDPCDPSTIHGMDSRGERHWLRKGSRGMRPNLRDDVTVNSLLGKHGTVMQVQLFMFFTVLHDGDATEDGRTKSICRAWIAAHKGDK